MGREADTHIRVTEETWKELNQRKGPGDSFEDVISRLLDEDVESDTSEDILETIEKMKDDSEHGDEIADDNSGGNKIGADSVAEIEDDPDSDAVLKDTE
jgi:predicted CopG family antitoxin